jgi:hypothetical protein
MRRVFQSPNAVILAAAAGFYAVFIARSAFRVNGTVFFSLFDDAMISMNYARNLAHGHGLVWNPGGHPVEGYTNLLWTLWMALLHLLNISEAKISLLVMASGAVLLLANALVFGAIARRLTTSRVAPLVAVALTAFYYPLVYWTLRGMEVGLLTLLVSVGILLTLRLEDRFSRADLAALCGIFAAALLTRTDALIFCIVLAAYVISRSAAHRGTAVIVLGSTIATTLAAATAFRLLYYGVALPNTYYLKLHGIGLSTRLPRGLLSLGSLELFHLWAPTLIAGWVLWRKRPRPAAYLLAAIFLAGCSYSVYVGGDAWEWMQYSNRYVTPGVPSLLVLCAIGLEAVVTHPDSSSRKRLLLPAAFAGVFLFTLHDWIPGERLQFNDVERGQPVQVAALLLAAAWIIIPRDVRNRSLNGVKAAPSGATGFLAFVFVIAMQGFAILHWVEANADYAMTFDAPATKYGLALRATTSPDATIAVSGAGAITYFAHRRSIDLLGKSDHKIAMESPRRRSFLPGHDKWDYRYSIHELRPDVVADLYSPTRRDLADMRAWGYVRLVSRKYRPFVRSDDGRVISGPLARFLSRGVEPLREVAAWAG